MEPTFWLDLFTYQTWKEFLEAGAKVSGFRENRWNAVQRMKPGDILLCYLTAVSRWIGLLEVTGPGFKDTTPIWKGNEFPARISVKLLAKLEPSTGIPVIEMKDKLSIFQNLKSPYAWTGRFRGSPYKWATLDGQAVVEAIREAVEHPVERPFDPAKLNKTPPILKASKGAGVTIPDDDEPETGPLVDQPEPTVAPPVVGTVVAEKEQRVHTEMQWLLLKLGNDMGLDVWVARNDRNQSYSGCAFASLPNFKQKLPLAV